MKNLNYLSLILLLIYTLTSCGVKKTPQLYVSYETNQKDKSQFTVFVKDKKIDTLFYGFQIGFEKDTSDLVYSNQYRLQKASVFKFKDSLMVKTDLTVLTGGESEFTYKTPGKLDYTGGWHGDEQLTEINFIADNKVVDLNESFKLLPFNSFKYVQKSTIHETASVSQGVNNNHPIEAIHLKTTSFGENGYKTINTIEWQKNLDLVEIYGSLVCLSRDFGGYGKSKNTDTVKFDIDGGFKLKSTDNSISLWNKENRTKAFIESEFSVIKDSTSQWIRDHKVYNKYYRDLGQIKAVEKDIWTFSTKVEFEKSE
jgi:hypothetical protein